MESYITMKYRGKRTNPINLNLSTRLELLAALVENSIKY